MTILSNQNYALMGLHHSVKLPSIIQFPLGLKKKLEEHILQGLDRLRESASHSTQPLLTVYAGHMICVLRGGQILANWILGATRQRANSPSINPCHFFRAAVRRGRILDQLGDSGRRDEEPIRERGCKISDARTRAQDRCLHKWP